MACGRLTAAEAIGIKGSAEVDHAAAGDKAVGRHGAGSPPPGGTR